MPLSGRVSLRVPDCNTQRRTHQALIRSLFIINKRSIACQTRRRGSFNFKHKLKGQPFLHRQRIGAIETYRFPASQPPLLFEFTPPFGPPSSTSSVRRPVSKLSTYQSTPTPYYRHRFLFSSLPSPLSPFTKPGIRPVAY